MLVGIMVLACTPKESEAGKATETPTAELQAESFIYGVWEYAEVDKSGTQPKASWAGPDFEMDEDGMILLKYTGNETHVTIPYGVLYIGERAFMNKQITNVTIPDSVSQIWTGAFGATNLTSVDIPSSVTMIGAWAFGSCQNLTSIDIPSSVTLIGEEAFGGSTNLKNATISISTRLENNAFESDVQIHYRDFHIERHSDDLFDVLSGFDSFYEYYDPDNSSEMIVIWTEKALKRFDIISINYELETGSLALERILFSINVWLPEDVFFLNTYIGEGIPTRGISFLDENNHARFFSISESGVTNGVYHLQEFNWNG
jgi:hypothetical protein